MSKQFKPRQIPYTQPAPAPAPEDDPSMVVLDALDAIAGAMEMQATLAAANFILHNPHGLPDGVLQEVTHAARAAALGYLRDPDTPPTAAALAQDQNPG